MKAHLVMFTTGSYEDKSTRAVCGFESEGAAKAFVANMNAMLHSLGVLTADVRALHDAIARDIDELPLVDDDAAHSAAVDEVYRKRGYDCAKVDAAFDTAQAHLAALGIEGWVDRYDGCEFYLANYTIPVMPA